MQYFGLATGVLIMAAAYIHHGLGTRKIWLPALKAMETANVSERIRGTIGFMWHGITLWSIAMGLMAFYAFFTFTSAPEFAAAFYIAIAVMNAAFAIVATFYGKVNYGYFKASPQWLFFWPISICAYLAYISV